MLEPGTRVSVTYEATVTDRRNPLYPELPCVRTKGGSEFGMEPGDVVEVITPPQPVLEDGAVYRHSATGTFYQYDKGRDSFRAVGVQGWIKISTTRHRLVRMVPENV